jgi:hypothetical protein
VATFTPRPKEATPAAEQTTHSAGPAATETPLPPDFEEVIVDLRYSIPGLALERHLQGNMANRITMVDLTSGRESEYRNQGGVLLELRQALPEADLQAMPADCDLCAFLQYDLTLEGQSDSGWLQDDVLLASLENYMAVGLGAHFPPETVLGLRRSASPYAPAHTAALTADGRLWTWLATDALIPEPSTAITASRRLRLSLDQILLNTVAEEYVVGCSGSPVETMYLQQENDELSVSIVCPEFSLPSTLLPIYLQLDGLLAPVIVGVSLPRPPAAFPLAALLDYRRADGARLTLFQDGTLVAIDASTTTVTSTLTSTQVISLTGALLESGELQPGLSTFGIEATPVVTPAVTTATPQPSSVLVLRGPMGLLEGEWVLGDGISTLAALDSLLNEILGIVTPAGSQQTTSGTPVATTAAGTPAVTMTQTISAAATTAAETAVPAPTATP